MSITNTTVKIKKKQEEIFGQKTKDQTNMEKGKKIHIDTSLMGKEEVFKMLALAEAARLPVLFVGPPGVAKTNTVLDYAAAGYKLDTPEGKEQYENDVYILETDEGTKSSEIKGRLNMREFIQNHEFVLNTPAATAKYVVINEIDKASGGMRNSFLGMMNERYVYNGENKIPCKWELFVATCNEIPKEEVDSPFWDRFILKYTVNRMTMDQLTQYFKNGDKKFNSKFDLYIPTEEEISNIIIPNYKLSSFLDVAYKNLSDRTLSYVPRLTKIVSLVFGVGINSALIKTAEILIGPAASQTLSKKLITPEMKTIYDKMDLIPGIKDKEHYVNVMDEIGLIISNFRKSNKITDEQIEELQAALKEIETKSIFYVDLIDDTE